MYSRTNISRLRLAWRPWERPCRATAWRLLVGISGSANELFGSHCVKLTGVLYGLGCVLRTNAIVFWPSGCAPTLAPLISIMSYAQPLNFFAWHRFGDQIEDHVNIFSSTEITEIKMRSRHRRAKNSSAVPKVSPVLRDAPKLPSSSIKRGNCARALNNVEKVVERSSACAGCGIVQVDRYDELSMGNRAACDVSATRPAATHAVSQRGGASAVDALLSTRALRCLSTS